MRSVLVPRRKARAREAEPDRPPIFDVIDLAVLRVRQDPAGFDPALLFRELGRAHRVEVIGRIIADRPRGWARGTGGAARFARYVCELAGRPALPCPALLTLLRIRRSAGAADAELTSERGPSPMKTPPKHRHYKPKDLGVVRIAGHDYYTGKYGSPESQAKYHRLLAEHWSGSLVPPVKKADRNPPSILELIARFTRLRVAPYYVKDGEPTGEATSFRSAFRWLEVAYGHTEAAKFGPRDLKAVRAGMVAGGNARTTINRYVGRIRQMFRWAVSEDLYPATGLVALQAVEGLKVGRSEAREPEGVAPVPAEAVERTLPHLGGHLSAVVRLLALTGARPGEICRMTPGEVDRSDPEVWVYRPARHKTQHKGKSRAILFGPKAQAVLLPWLDRDPAAPCFQPYEAHPNRTGPKAAKPGRPYDPNTLRAAVARACDRAGVPHWHPNQLRHSAATTIRAMSDLEGAQAILGHSRPDTTTIYAERAIERGKAIMRAIG